MKKLVLVSAAAAAIAAAAASITPASALTILKPGCCGGYNPNPGGGFHPHWGFGGGVTVGLVGVDSGISGGCYFVRRSVLVPGIGIVNKRQLVCD